MTQQLPPTNLQHQINPEQQVVMVRQTASGFEQGVAAMVGLLTAGPIGALASWGCIRGLQGKWLPWAIIGVPAAPVLVAAQLAVGFGGLAVLHDVNNNSTPAETTYQEQVRPAPVTPAPVVQVPEYGEVTTETAGPQAISNSGSLPVNSCWFQQSGRSGLSGSQCEVNSRINNNGHKVYDVVESNGTKRAIVLWNDRSSEVFLEGTRYVGTWSTDSDGDVRVRVNGGEFAFTPND